VTEKDEDEEFYEELHKEIQEEGHWHWADFIASLEEYFKKLTKLFWRKK
jgi:hypothetical protein